MDQSTASIKPSDVLREAARRCNRYGFNISLGLYDDSCGCFIHHLCAARRAIAQHRGLDTLHEAVYAPYSAATRTLESIVTSAVRDGDSFGDEALAAAGWINAPKRDAVAAFLIAADIAEAEGQ
jgi:hypothetical protein